MSDAPLNVGFEEAARAVAERVADLLGAAPRDEQLALASQEILRAIYAGRNELKPKMPRVVTVSECGTHCWQVSKHGQKITVDIADRHLLDWYYWSVDKAGYAIAYSRHLKVSGKSASGFIKLHREVFGATNAKLIDHIDGDRLNNRRSNLRPASKSQNAANSITYGGLGFKGVALRSNAANNKKPYVAKIQINYKPIHLGYFETPIEAATAYDNAAVRYFGEFAKTNKAMGLY